ncbi:MAG: MaoC/PaaZ C-terminal domain-containing protein [Halobacteriaceae archaeon]
MPLYFEDLPVGETRELGTVTVSREDIIAFAERYDPQPIHADPDAAAAGPYGGVIASGWHTASLCMRQLVEGFLSETATRGALGVDGLRWRTPLRPGDELTVRGEIAETEVWDDDRGLAHCRVEATNGEGDEVLSMVGLVLFARRE